MFDPVSNYVVGDAYHIAANYLKATGRLSGDVGYSPAVAGFNCGRFPVRQDEQIDPCQSGNSAIRKNQRRAGIDSMGMHGSVWTDDDLKRLPAIVCRLWYAASRFGSVETQHRSVSKSGKNDWHTIHADADRAQEHEGQVRRRRKGVGPMTQAIARQSSFA